MKVTQIYLGDFFLGRVPAAALPNAGPRFPLYPRHAVSPARWRAPGDAAAIAHALSCNVLSANILVKV